MNNIKKAILIYIMFIFIFNNIFASSWVTLKQVDSSTFLWIKKSRTAKILDDFKNKQQKLVFDNIPLSKDEESLIFDYDWKINSYENILNRLENIKKQYKEQKRTVSIEKINLNIALKQLDDSIETTNKSIKEIIDIITFQNKKIEEYINKNNDLELKINTNKSHILNYLNYIYSKWTLVYSNDNKDVDVIRSIILNDWNLSDIMNDIHLKTIIELNWQNLINTYKDLIKENYFNKENLKKTKIENLKLKKELDLKNRYLTSQKEYKENLLKITKWKEALFNKYINSKQENQLNVKNKIWEVFNDYNEVFTKISNKYNCDISIFSWSFNIDNVDNLNELIFDKNPKCLEIKKYFILEKKLKKEEELEEINPFLWPVEPYNWISSYFYDPEYFKQLWSKHEAIDIPIFQWTDIIAPANGYVYFVYEPEVWEYWYIAIKHQSWFVTIYWHVSEVYVKQFDFIQAWQVFAKSWWAPWTKWAWIMTSWPHLHFEIYKNRESVDPLRFLNLTHLKFEKLDSKYQYKYIEDLKSVYWNRANTSKYKTFYIYWETETERQKNLLNKYATSDFNNWDIWVEEWINGKIDPSFLMCLWLAETWLWKSLKTSFNVWNVWNTDSWSTYDFLNPKEWVYWIVKTLNNKFLKEYSTIDQLSRWWNNNWSIYASSNKSWHTNVVKCLSSLKWRFIEDNYSFRIDKNNN